MGQENLNKTFNEVKVVKNVSTATTLKNTESGQLIVIDASTGFNLTLPSCETGLNYKILVKTGGTDGAMKILVASGDAFFGTVHVYDNNTDGEEQASQTITYATATGTPGNHGFLRLDGDATTTGCTAGDIIELYAIDEDAWLVKATLGTSGTPASITTIGAS